MLRSRHFRVAAFTQHHMDQLDLALSPLEFMFDYAKLTEPEITVDEVRGRFLCGRRDISPPRAHASRRPGC